MLRGNFRLDYKFSWLFQIYLHQIDVDLIIFFKLFKNFLLPLHFWFFNNSIYHFDFFSLTLSRADFINAFLSFSSFIWES